MTVEAATYVNDFNTALPDGADSKSQGDDHLRLVKSVLKNTFPGLAGRIGRVQYKSADYTLTPNDNLSLIAFTAGSNLLGNAGSAAATVGNGFYFFVLTPNTGITFDPNGAETVNGSATFAIPNNTLCVIWSDGTGWFAFNISTPVDGDLTALAALSGTGYAVRTGTNAWAQRTFAGTANQITATNPDGVAGNTSFALANPMTTPGDLTVGGNLILSSGFTMAGILNLGSTGQIQFPATQNASGGANVLDDYEEGTFTVSIAFGGGTTGQTYAFQSGQYTKIGRAVICAIKVGFTNKGSSTGTASVIGLPFASGFGVDGPNSHFSWDGMTTALVNIAGRVTSSGTDIPLKGIASAQTSLASPSLSNTDFANASILWGGFAYNAF